MSTPRQDPRRRRLLSRRPPAVHRPVLPAPETPEEVLDRAPALPRPPDLEWVTCADLLTPCLHAGPHVPVGLDGLPVPDVSRETWAELEAALEAPAQQAIKDHAPMAAYVAGGQVPPSPDALAESIRRTSHLVAPDAAEEAVLAAATVPPLRKEQVARLEALTAIWERKVRLEGPPDATMLYTGSSRPPVPPPAAVTPPPSVSPAEEAPAGPPARISAWASRHDPRSLEFALRDRLAHPAPLRDVLLAHGPILDQGTTPPLTLREASACTGMAAVAAANVLELAPGPHVPRRLLDETDARRVYERAQDLDEKAGHDYAGTSVLAVMKAGQSQGWWGSYLWALGGTRDVAQALVQLCAPVVLGLPWPAGMESPDAAGIVRPTGAAGMGHALTVVGLVRQLSAAQLEVATAPQAGVHFILQQSRGTAEGVGGLVYLHHRDLAQLLAGSGEAAVPLSV